VCNSAKAQATANTVSGDICQVILGKTGNPLRCHTTFRFLLVLHNGFLRSDVLRKVRQLLFTPAPVKPGKPR